MCGSTPPPPEAPPPPPTEREGEIAGLGDRQKRARLAGQSGFQSTILTGTQGAGNPNVSKPTLGA